MKDAGRFILLPVGVLLGLSLLLAACGNTTDPEIRKSREEAIPEDAVKVTPEADNFPPITQHDGWIAGYAGELKWTGLKNAGARLNRDLDIGEWHVSLDGDTLYYGGMSMYLKTVT